MSACVAGRSTIVSHRGFGRSSARIGNRPASVSFPRRRAISASAVALRSPAAATEKLEYWMRESVVEIVKSLGTTETAASPLLVHVYSEDEGMTRIRTERAGAGDWNTIKRRWGSGEEAAPEGIILVEELKDELEEAEEEGNLVNNGGWEGQNGEKNTKAWGVVLMGRGEEGGVASFLLKTTRGGSQFGRGMGGLSCNCTHFSLVKVKSFTQSTRSQLSNCWLVQAP